MRAESEENLGGASAGSWCPRSFTNLAEIPVLPSGSMAPQALLDFALAAGVTPLGGHLAPGTFSNQIQAALGEPRLVVFPDPRADRQPLTELASAHGWPQLALCNTDSPALCRHCLLELPQGSHSEDLMWWVLAQEVVPRRGTK